MSIIITFDVTGANSNQRNRVQSFFQRLGWELLGGSAYRYPRLGTDDQPVEDWMNHVVPALMLFRAFALRDGIEVTKFTIDAQVSTGFSPNTHYGNPIQNGEGVQLYTPTNTSFGTQNLRDWMSEIEFPY